MKTIKVLLIDKEAEFTSILTDRLNSWGYMAVAANSIEEALEQLNRFRPNVVVLGVESGSSDTLPILDTIKKKSPAAEIILLTGKGAARTAVTGMQRGAFDVLSQPIELGVLIDSIRRANLHRRKR